MRVLTTNDIRAVEQSAYNSGISYLQMMENAGSYCARIIRKTYENTNKRKVLVVCGKGNNGGDGFVIARKLKEDDFNVVVMMASGFPKTDESTEMLSRVRAMGISILHFDVNGSTDKAFDSAEIIVDCVFGIGFEGEVEGAYRTLFEKINSARAQVISIDVPSGLSGNGTTVSKYAVRADLTVTVISLKPVHVYKASKELCGEVVCVPIGIPEKCFENADSLLFTMSNGEIKEFFTARDTDSHKGNYGTVLVIGGSYEMPNAVCIASKAAVNSGAGLVKVAFPSSAYSAVAPKTFEQTLIPLNTNKNGRISQNSLNRIGDEMKKCTCIVLGCGMGVDADTKRITEFVIKNSVVPVIVDADGINCLADDIDILKEAKAPIILTPHPKEMARLLKCDVGYVLNNREKIVHDFTEKYNVILVLKGSSTLVGSSRYSDVFVNTTGNAGMATGGSGDLLAGIIASFTAQGMEPYKSAVAGVNIHGLAGDRVTEKYSMMGNTPTLMLEELSSVLKNFE